MIEMKVTLHDPEELRFMAEFCTKLADVRQARYGSVELAGPENPWPVNRTSTQIDAPDLVDTADTDDAPRAYGEASEGRKRRTKEEMAEDAEIEELCAKIGRDPKLLSEPASELLWTLRQAAAARNISTRPEDRQEPEFVSGEIVEDEPEAPTATRDDLKAAMAELVEAKGGMEDGFPVVMEVFAEYGKTKQSDFPDDPVLFAEVIAKLKARL